MLVTAEQLIERIADSGLLTVGEASAIRDSLSPDSDSDSLVSDLIDKGKLTQFQANVLREAEATPLVLGDYVILDLIGKGGMGDVFKARHQRMDRVVALKTLPIQRVDRRDAIERFRREVKATAKLNHANIVTVYDAREDKGIHFFVMEFVDGEDLRSLVKRQRRLPVNAAVNYIIQAAKGLQYAHSHGIYHRDVKPANLILDGNGTVKVLDLGLAKLEQEIEGEHDLTATGMMLGTAAYLSPEQATSASDADHRSDIYSLGCTLFYLLIGKPPYVGDTTVNVIVAHREEPVPSLRDGRSDVARELDHICQKMMAKEPSDRHQSMEEVIEGLECLVSVAAAPDVSSGLAATQNYQREQLERDESVTDTLSSRLDDTI